MCIHMIMHLADSIRDFGGVYNYSTFNFENYLGVFTFMEGQLRLVTLEENLTNRKTVTIIFSSIRSSRQ